MTEPLHHNSRRSPLCQPSLKNTNLVKWHCSHGLQRWAELLSDCTLGTAFLSILQIDILGYHHHCLCEGLHS